VLARNGERPATDCTVNGARKVNRTGKREPSSRLPANSSTIRADLTGSSSCTAVGVTARGNAPGLALCRRLVEAGHDPATRLEVYRGTTLALRIRSIGEGAKLTVRESTKDGRPRFVRLGSGDVGPQTRKSGPAATAGWTDWPAAAGGGRRP
jgi:hypothetical protein